MMGRLRRHRQQADYCVCRCEARDHVGEWRISKYVGVVSEEHRIAFDEPPNAAQPLADRRMQAGVHEGNPPVGDVRLEQLNISGTAAEDEVVGPCLVVVKEEILDRRGAVAEAEYEVPVPVMR